MTSDSKSSATLKNILGDLLSNNTDEEIKIILSQQDNVEETVCNTLAQKYVEEIISYFDEQIAGMKFYMKMCSNELKKKFMREYANDIRTIAPEENPPPVTGRDWVRVSVRLRVVGQFSSGAIVLEPTPM